ncbi:MAG: GNAT family N-acetyltransferase [Gemmatimonadota bacterium]
MSQPTLTTDHLVLRPFTAADADDVQTIAGEREIAYNTATIPHPYPEGAAEAWILAHADAFQAKKGAVFAITLRETGELVGAVGLNVEPEHTRAELGYWIGKTFWNHGYATEAARQVVRFGFQAFGLLRLYARAFVRNQASRRVLEKIGMRYEGRLRGHFLKWGEPLDLDMFGLLATDTSPGKGT